MVRLPRARRGDTADKATTTNNLILKQVMKTDCGVQDLRRSSTGGTGTKLCLSLA